MSEFNIKASIETWHGIKQDMLAMFEELADDPEALRDTVEGETDIDPVALVEELVEKIAEAEGYAASAKQRAADAAAREDRFKKGADRLRALTQQVMEIAKLKKVQAGGATVSLRPTQQKAIITDEALIPSKFWKAQEPKLSLTDLTNALKEGDVPGATLSNAGSTVSIRTK
jgi:hypothetical protein